MSSSPYPALSRHSMKSTFPFASHRAEAMKRCASRWARQDSLIASMAAYSAWTKWSTENRLRTSSCLLRSRWNITGSVCGCRGQCLWSSWRVGGGYDGLRICRGCDESRIALDRGCCCLRRHESSTGQAPGTVRDYAHIMQFAEHGIVHEDGQICHRWFLSQLYRLFHVIRVPPGHDRSPMGRSGCLRSVDQLHK